MILKGLLFLALGINVQAMDPGDVLLPSHLVPELYKVRLLPFLVPDNFTIDGRVEISVTCVAPGGNNVTLHATEMIVNDVRVFELVNGSSNAVVAVAGWRLDAQKEFLVADLEQELSVGSSYLVTVDFVANLNDKLHGFYRNTYKNDDGEDVFMAVTQFEPTHARAAFPCFDEPARKAKFEVCLGRRQQHSSISNMPLLDRKRGLPMEGTDEYVWDQYEMSVPMSTYLVAFVVSDFEFDTAKPTGNNVTFRVWARGNALDQVEYAKSTGPKILKYFEEFFNVTYPLPKMDMIAIPDFSAGAMENWGLITYRETALLVKPGVSSQGDKESVASVIGHELAHQWFGNLVTPSWWTDLWLNEGFASYVEYLGVDAVHPEWRLLHKNMISEVHKAMALDVLENSHPISIPVKNPDEISEIFDTISYLKGASIIRMMDHYLGRKTFRQGLSDYLLALRFKAATQDDLWHHLSEAAFRDHSLPSNLSVKRIMDTWTLQTGYPLVTVIRNYESNSAVLNQERFRLSKLKQQSDNETSSWWIPITFCQPGLDNFQHTDNPVWMEPGEKNKTVSNLPDAETAVIFNVQESGFYRVNYDAKNWALIYDQFERDHNEVHVLNRAQVVDDVFNLARSGVLDYKLALGFTRYLKKELDYIVWRPINAGLGYIEKMLKRTPCYGEYLRYMRNLVRPLYQRIGHDLTRFDGGDKVDVFFHQSLVAWACHLELPECCDRVKVDFHTWMLSGDDADKTNPIDTELRRTAYCSAVREGGEEEWNFAWQRYRNSNVAAERRNLLRALSCTRQVWLLNRFLNLSVTVNSGVRLQDVPSVFSLVASNIYGRDLAFDFLREKWAIVKEYVGPKGVGRLIKSSILDDRNTNLELRELKQFFDDYLEQLGGGVRTVQQFIEKTEKNIAWMEHNYHPILEWLQQENEMSHQGTNVA